MGAPKQKWTAEEEDALKAGVRKHGTGKWQAILKDPEFSNVLISRSNVDLKDKWRNINVTASGLGSREKARLALKRIPHISTHDKTGTLSNLVQSEEKIAESKSPSAPRSGDSGEASVSKRSFTRLESVILESISTLKEPHGSDRNGIATYIKENYWEPPDFKKLLSTKLKTMNSNGKLVKANHRYKLAASSSPCRSRTDSLNNKPKNDVPPGDKNGFRILTDSEVNAELDKMRIMSSHEVATAAARAIVEAEAAIAEAEKAAMEAEAAEAEAEAAHIFAHAAKKACQRLSVC